MIDESNPQCNVAGDIASVMGDRAFDYLDGPIKSNGARYSCTIPQQT